MVDARNDVHWLCCMMCFKVKGKEKFLVPKIYNLLNHTNRHKDKVASVNIQVGSFYFETLNANMHVMNKYTQTLSVL